MQKILLFSVLVITLSLGGCDWFRGLQDLPGLKVGRGQRAIKAIPASPVGQAQQVRWAQPAQQAPKDSLDRGTPGACWKSPIRARPPHVWMAPNLQELFS
jgi:hypothetical protein